MFLKKKLTLTIATLAISVTTLSVSAETLRYAHVGAEGDSQTRYASEAAASIEEATDGEITFSLFPSSQLGGVAEMVDGVSLGSISMAHHEFASLAQTVPDIAVFNAPFIYRDAEHALKATDPHSPVISEMNEKLVEEGDMRIIGRMYRGARHITANFPVYSPADLEGKPFRAVPLDIWISMVNGFGADPTPVEVSELPTSLMTGLVVGQENPLTMLMSNSLYEVQSHVSMTGHMHSILAVFINEDTWQSLDEGHQETITRILEEKAQESLQWAQEREASLVEELKEKGMTFVTEENGLELEAFREQVLAQINEDYPNFQPYIEQIAEIE
ncbi:TRAP transporter substrate-binding protein [Halomonas sp. QX-2]|jgi:tripartite ATP-independent transporter DctP family solute receptor|uniref:TRAP transporter substrate-binding protein n=1 Tax=Vreelandella sedimenti TaxID=2729618 RepID=A0A7Z0N944_9GAMM|nr:MULTISPECIES: TRAP transporter substrate-binding protein [Halomonas]NYT73683.1 TRAP transporter substrate-binding protein [Halomonas sedimenti]|tara:strand:+ start:1041 stop:2030 length:990 start_codon:yes stop_codon:yes gene_type:complete